MKFTSFKSWNHSIGTIKDSGWVLILSLAVCLFFPGNSLAGPTSIGGASSASSSLGASDLLLVHCCHNHPYSPNDRYCCHDGQYYGPAAPRVYAPGYYSPGRAVVGGAVAYGTYKGVKKTYKKAKKIYKKHK